MGRAQKLAITATFLCTAVGWLGAPHVIDFLGGRAGSLAENPRMLGAIGGSLTGFMAASIQTMRGAVKHFGLTFAERENLPSQAKAVVDAAMGASFGTMLMIVAASLIQNEMISKDSLPPQPVAPASAPHATLN